MNAKLSRHVADLRYTVGALYASLVNLEGQVLVESGGLGTVDKNALNQLLSGSVKQSRELAQAFKEPRSLDLHYYGKRYEIFCRQVEDSTFLALVIDRENSTVRAGGVLLYLKRAIDAIRKEFEAEESRRAPRPRLAEQASIRPFDRGNAAEPGIAVTSDSPMGGNGESRHPAPPAREFDSAAANEKRAESKPPPLPAPSDPETSSAAPEDESLILEDASLDSAVVEETRTEAAPGGETFDLEEAIRRGLVPREIARRLGPRARGDA